MFEGKVLLLALSLVFLFSFASAAGIYWVSASGTAAWASCQSATPLSGTSACAYTTAASNAVAGDTVYFRSGTYYLDTFQPSNSGSSWSNQINFSAYGGEAVIFTQNRVANWNMELGSSWSNEGSPTINERSADKAYAGTYSRKFVVDAAGEGIKSDTFSMTGGINYNYYLWVYPSTTSVNVYVRKADDSGALIDVTHSGLTANTWNLIKGSGAYVASSGSSAYIAIRSPTGTSSGTWYVENVRVFPEQPPILLLGKAYIKFHRLIFDNTFRGFMFLNGASYNEVSYSTFTNNDAGDYYVGHTISFAQSTGGGAGNPSQYNWIHHSTFGNYGRIEDCGDWGDMFRIGEDVSGDTSSYNLIEDSTFYGGGHSILLISTRYNTIRNNVFHNEGWLKDHWGNCYNSGNATSFANRILLFEDPSGTNTNFNLIESNRFGHADLAPEDDAGSGIESPASKTIIRYNSFFNNHIAGYETKRQNSNGSNNRIYNNTFYNNGLSENPYASAILLQCYTGDPSTGNVFKNNILYGNYRTYHYYGSPDCRGLNTYSNNYESDPSFVNTDTSDPTSLVNPDLHLQGVSEAINGGTYLTTVHSSDSGSGTSLKVVDATYFQDGTWAPSAKISADWICIANVSNCVQISSINYSTNTITLANPTSRKVGDSIWLYKDSSGKQVLYGPAPDYGAYEYSGTGPTCTDADGDGYGTTGSTGCTYTGTDCNDADSSVHPGAVEKCGDGKDNDCSGGDAACSTCSQGAIPSSGCNCGGVNYYSGYCCIGNYQATSCGGLDYFTFEAEDGVLVSPMGSVSDSSASGGKYIRTTASGLGTADYGFIASGGNYIVWSLSRVGDGDGDPSAHNSFYVLMDGSSEDVWHVPISYTGWTWDQVSGVSAGDPRIFNLSAGSHTLRFRGRETDTRLDKLVITNDLSYNPAAPQCADNDGDSYGTGCLAGSDCNDANPSINPGATENCSDAVDNDCDSLVDCLDPNCFANTACTQCSAGQIRCNNICITPACTTNANCNDNNALTTDTCSQPGTCSAACVFTPCTIRCSSNSQCNDSNSLTSDICVNAGACNSSCYHETYQNCPELITQNCNCGGNIYSSGLCCGNTYRAQATCSTDAQCDDQNSLTNDTCLNAGTCSASCSYTPINQPICTEGQTTACVTTDNCAGTRTCLQGAWGDCVKDNPNCPVPPVCSEGTTQECTTLDECAGTQTCVNNSWSSCTKLDASCPITGPRPGPTPNDLDADNVASSIDCNDRDPRSGLCTGCAVCAGGKCVAGSCPSTACLEKSECKGEHCYSYPATVSNECTLQGGLGTCASKKCIPQITLNYSKCTIPGHVTQPPEIPGEITEKPPIQEAMPIQILAAAITIVAIAVFLLGWALRRKQKKLLPQTKA